MFSKMNRVKYYLMILFFSDITKINDLLDKLSNELSNHIVREIYKGVHLNDAS